MLLLLGAIALHQLRYSLIPPPADAAGGHAHGYLAAVAPMLGMGAAIALARLLIAAALAPGRASARAVRAQRVWPLATTALLGIFSLQELAEGALSAGHPDGVEGVFGAGGLIALPLAAVIGAVIATVVRVAQQLQDAQPVTAGLVRPLRSFFRDSAAVLTAPVPHLPGPAPLADRAAGRAPPLAITAT